MRKHGWQLPYHPLQVVALAVFLALGFAFYVFFAPFVGKQLFQYIAMAIYTPLIMCVFGLYIWCAGSDPADSGVLKSKKYLKSHDHKKHAKPSESKHGGESTGEDANDVESNPEPEKNNDNSSFFRCFTSVLFPCAYFCKSHEESADQQMSEDGMFYCSLCEVEVYKYSKHCRVCDKCVDRFDHHCRWLNNCIGKKNYRKFFTLMVSSLLLLILQWSTGILVLIMCFIERKHFAKDIRSKLGSSFTIVPFVIVVAVCTILAMIATLPVAQLFFFHILLIKKGISTYDYIIALRDQDQAVGGSHQSVPMSPASSITGLSTASSFNAFNRAAWCTPPKLFLEDQFDVVPPDNASVSSLGKKTIPEDPTKKKNPAPVKISPWALARLNPEDVSKAAAEARKKSKILRPVTRHDPIHTLETGSRKRGSSSKRIRLPVEMPQIINEASTNAFRERQTISGSFGIIASSPESSLDSPEVNPFGGVSSSGGADVTNGKDILLSRSNSDGYDASGGEDSDRVPPVRILGRPVNWSNALFGYEQNRNGGKI